MQRHSKRNLSAEDGYTLTEILVVMAIIGLIAAVLTPGLVGQLGRARSKTTQVQLETIASAIEIFRADVGRYPTESEGLQVLLTDPANADGWSGPYLKSNKVLKDSWGNTVEYEAGADGVGFLVKSLGADGRANGTGQNRDLTAPANQ